MKAELGDCEARKLHIENPPATPYLLPRKLLAILFIVFSDVDHGLPFERGDRDPAKVRYLPVHISIGIDLPG